MLLFVCCYYYLCYIQQNIYMKKPNWQMFFALKQIAAVSIDAISDEVSLDTISHYLTLH